MKVWSGLLALLSGAILIGSSPSAQAQVPSECNILARGAVADDGIDDTVPFQAALYDCGAAGLPVHIPAGRFDLGHVRLPSGTDLRLSPNTVLAASLDLADYPPIAAIQGRRAWLYADGQAGISISGAGLFDGQAAPVYAMMEEIIAVDRNDPRADERVRFGIHLRNCNNVRIRDIRMRNTQMYFLNLTDCDDAVIDGVNLSAPHDSHNTDGIQIADSRDVRISNCRIAVGDDAIVTKARERPIERLMVNNCALTSDDAAIKFGTRSASAVRDSVFSDIAISESRYGIALFMINGGEYTNNRFTDISIATGGRHNRTYPIFVDIDDRVDDPSARQFGVVDGLSFSGVDIRSAGNLLIAGHPEAPIRNLALTDIRIATSAGETIDADDSKPKGNRRYDPVPGSPDLAPIDATLVLGHVDGLTLDDVTIRGESGRADFHFESIADASGNAAPD